MSMYTIKDHIINWQDKITMRMLELLRPSLVKRVFFQDADPAASIQHLHDDIVLKTVEFTEYINRAEWEVQAGAAVIVAAKLVMGHDYVSNEAILFHLISSYISNMHCDEVIQKLLHMESYILNKTIFNITPPVDHRLQTNKRKRECECMVVE